MKTIRARHAKMRFLELIDAAARGRPTTIMRRGVPVAVIAPIADARKIYPAEAPSFVDFLLTVPGGAEFERDSPGYARPGPVTRRAGNRGGPHPTPLRGAAFSRGREKGAPARIAPRNRRVL